MAGVYVSYPFCAQKCTYCNFASGVFPRDLEARYLEALQAELSAIHWPWIPQTVYLGGGTPSTLSSDQLRQTFSAVRNNFDVQPDSEITVECAPGTLSPKMIDTLLACRVNRVSLGVQSFIDKEAAAVGRLHTRAQTLADIDNLRASGINTSTSISLPDCRIRRRQVGVSPYSRWLRPLCCM